MSNSINLVIEIFGAVTGLLYIFFSIRQNIWLWPLGIFTSATYIYVFFVTRFYADMSLQVYYLGVSIYGWYHWWRFKHDRGGSELPVSRLTLRTGVILAVLFLALYIVILHVLKNYTNSDVYIGDAFTTALSIVATWMLARKIIEHWILWVVVDTISCGLYIYKGMYPTVILFVVYTIMAVKGYQEWKKTLASPAGIQT
jgi:nicotinamide mononucleotide transporter